MNDRNIIGMSNDSEVVNETVSRDNIKYLIIHDLWWKTIHGYFDTIDDVNEELTSAFNGEPDDDEETVQVLEVNVDEIEQHFGSKLEDIDPWDVAEKSKLIKEMTVEVKWVWKIEEAEGEDTFQKCYL